MFLLTPSMADSDFLSVLNANYFIVALAPLSFLAVYLALVILFKLCYIINLNIFKIFIKILLVKNYNLGL